MSTTDKNRNRLITLLKELFQLDQPELDFGLYKIMHAKSEQITKFLQSDLLKEIEAIQKKQNWKILNLLYIIILVLQKA